ncbi:tetraspanin [Echinococcus multilocularis]|uniref:Tetraspanin n=1 Tax=Echinococcus multilocularis TaxID=6211 RepID=A0A068Y232_ECHMU|nr:tetraspanin [Echinococcus multilocularis]
MGCVISCGLKLVLQILNTVLCVGFLAIAVFGIILKSSKSFVQKILEKIFQQDPSSNNEDLKQFANFIIENAGGIAIVLIVVGLALAALCLIGCIASCCGCGILLKIYAVILIILLVAQIIAVAVIFSDPNRTSGWLVSSLETILESYGEQDPKGSMSKAVWNLLMGLEEPFCCGMNGYEDFSKSLTNLPPACCNGASKTCDSNAAKTANVVGCKDKIVQFTTDNMKILMYVSIGAILLQAALIVIVMLVICL